MSLQSIFDPVARAVLTKSYKETLKGILGHTPFVLKGDVETEIYEDAFRTCGYITGIDMPSVTSVGSYSFAQCDALKSVNLPSVTSVGEAAFWQSALTSVNMPSVTSIGDGAFHGCKALTRADLPSAISLGQTAFYICEALTSVNIPYVTSITDMTFMACTSLRRVNIPSVKTIGMGAFGNCTALERIDLPSVTSIGQQAFGSCTALRTVILRTTETVCVADLSAFGGTPLLKGTGHIYVPSSMYEYYRAGYEAAVNVDVPGFFNILFRKIEDYPEICDGAVGEYYIEWDGNTEGRDIIELGGGDFSLHYYKVSNLIVDVVSLDSSYISYIVDEDQAIVPPAYNYAISLDGGAVLLSSGNPLVFSGKAGEYSLEGIDFEVPSDGTYFANDDGLFKIRALYSHATE